jgi:cholesterol transport system auxiliary component
MRIARSLFVFAIAGCALTGKSKPIDIHYYAPVLGTAALTPPEPAMKVRLGRISASDHLRAPIAHRTSPVEIGVYDTRRWTDPPEIYVRRVLERELSSRGREETEEVTLDVEVLAFEEVRTPRPAGRVQLRYRLRDQHGVLATGVITQAREARGSDFADVVVAIGAALDQAGVELARASAEAYRREVISRRGARSSTSGR